MKKLPDPRERGQTDLEPPKGASSSKKEEEVEKELIQFNEFASEESEEEQVQPTKVARIQLKEKDLPSKEVWRMRLRASLNRNLSGPNGHTPWTVCTIPL